MSFAPPTQFASTGRGLVAMWRRAGRGARLLFVLLGALFAFRSQFVGSGPGGDRAGFQSMGGGVLDGELLEDPQVNTYPPPFSVVMAPVAAAARLVGDRLVRVLWGLAQLASLLYFTLTAARVLRLDLTLGVVALAWLANWRFVVGDFNGQNVSLFLCALLALAISRADHGEARTAGVILGVGAALKLWPGIALWALLRQGGIRGRRALAGFLAGVLGMVLITAVALGPRFLPATRFWFTKVVPVAGGASLLNQAWRGLFLRWALPRLEAGDYDAVRVPDLPEVQRARLFAMAVGGALLMGLLLWLVLRPGRSQRVVALDAFLAVYALLPVLPLMWFHYLCAGLPIGLALIGGAAELSARRRLVARILFVGGTVLACFVDVDLVGRTVWAEAARLGTVLWGSLLVLAAGLALREGWGANLCVQANPEVGQPRVPSGRLPLP